MRDPLRPADPRLLGGYELLARLGEGGMGTVFLGHDGRGGYVAVKVIKPEYAGDAEFRARFRGEVDRARKVPPFCTAEVLDADPGHDPPYLVIEYVDGPSLSDVVGENGPLRGGSLHSVAVGVAAALVAIHGAGVIHRDLKPGNVLFALGTPKVIDFGISRALEATSRHTQPEEMVGTLAYMAPERIDDGMEADVSTAVDIFAWGAVVVFAATGRSPFGGDTPAITAARILTRPPRLDGLPPYLSGLVDAALDKDPANRPSAHELLNRLLAAGAAGAPEVPAELRQAAEAAQHTAVRSRRRRRRWLAVPVAAVVGAVALALGVNVFFADRGSVSPVVSSSAAPLEGPAYFDALTRGGAYQEYDSAKLGRCRYDRGFRVTTRGKTQIQCPNGSDNFPGRQTIDVRATLATANSCAALWFRVQEYDNDDDFGSLRQGYRLMLCADRVSLGVTDDYEGGLQELATAKRASTVGAAHRLVLVSDGSSATASVDGVELLQASTVDQYLTQGHVLLGAAGRGAADVRFTDLRIRSGTSLDIPPLPAVLSGDAVFTARMWSYSAADGTGLAEQTEFLTGAEYCRRNRVPVTTAGCDRKFVTVPGKVTVALPTAKKVVLREYRDGRPECVDRYTHAGLCPATDRDRLDAWMTEKSPFPVRLTVKNGTIVEMDELDVFS